jgi:hypothetical protein
LFLENVTKIMTIYRIFAYIIEIRVASCNEVALESTLVDPNCKGSKTIVSKV